VNRDVNLWLITQADFNTWSGSVSTLPITMASLAYMEKAHAAPCRCQWSIFLCAPPRRSQHFKAFLNSFVHRQKWFSIGDRITWLFPCMILGHQWNTGIPEVCVTGHLLLDFFYKGMSSRDFPISSLKHIIFFLLVFPSQRAYDILKAFWF